MFQLLPMEEQPAAELIVLLALKMQELMLLYPQVRTVNKDVFDGALRQCKLQKMR